MKKQSNNATAVAEGESSDVACVGRLKQGDSEAFSILVERHQKAIFNVVFRMLGNYDDAVEVSQETFLSAFRSIGSFRGDSSFSTWLYRIAINHAHTRRKSVAALQQRTLPIEFLESLSADDDPVDTVARNEIRDHVQAALNQLDPDDASILLLRDLQDVPYDEVSQVLDIPIGTVKSRLHRARQALKARLAPIFNGKGSSK